MLDASNAAPPGPVPSSTLADFEGLLPAPQNAPPKKSSLLSVFSWLTSTVRRNPFLSAVFLYTILTCFVAGVAKSAYNRDRREPGAKFAFQGDGASFSSASLVWF